MAHHPRRAIRKHAIATSVDLGKPEHHLHRALAQLVRVLLLRRYGPASFLGIRESKVPRGGLNPAALHLMHAHCPRRFAGGASPALLPASGPSRLG
jgi:hypothetical protein